jgi:hypothetical protein
MRHRRLLFRAHRRSGWGWRVFGDSEYRPLTIAVPSPRSKQSPWAMGGSLLLLCAPLVYVFGQ